MIRACLGPTSLPTPWLRQEWAHGLNQDANGIARSFTLENVVKRAVEKARAKGNRQPEYLDYWIHLHAKDCFLARWSK